MWPATRTTKMVEERERRHGRAGTQHTLVGPSSIHNPAAIFFMATVSYTMKPLMWTWKDFSTTKNAGRNAYGLPLLVYSAVSESSLDTDVELREGAWDSQGWTEFVCG